LTEKEVNQSFKEHKEKRKRGKKTWEVIKASQKPWSEYNAIDVDVVVEVDDHVSEGESPSKSYIINAPWKE
jgi:hypothetical protein